MGSSSGGKKKYVNYRNRQRAQMSFFIVVIFFAIFGLIVFAEIFLIDERGRGAGVLVRHGSLVYHSRQQEINEYEESLQVSFSFKIKFNVPFMISDVWDSHTSLLN